MPMNSRGGKFSCRIFHWTRHSLLQEASTRKFSCRMSIFVLTVKVFLLDCFVVYGKHSVIILTEIDTYYSPNYAGTLGSSLKVVSLTILPQFLAIQHCSFVWVPVCVSLADCTSVQYNYIMRT